jgi:DNA polymerase III subunit delta
MNYQEFSGDEHEVPAMLDFVGTAPFAADKRMAVVWGADKLGKDEKEAFLSAASKLPSTAVLVVESEQTNAKKDAFLRDLAEKGKLVACHPPFDRDLPGWVADRARKTGLALESRAAQHLIACSGGELSTIASNLLQLASYVHPKKQASLADAEALFKRRAEDDVFLLAELMLDQKKAEALRVLDALFDEGTRAPEIVAALGGQMERWKKASARLAEGRSPEEVGAELKIPSFFQGPFFAKLKKLTKAQLSAYAKGLLTCDEDFKSGRLPERLALERFIWSA